MANEFVKWGRGYHFVVLEGTCSHTLEYIHENIYFAVWIVVFLSFDSVVFFGPVICPCHLFVIFFIFH